MSSPVQLKPQWEFLSSTSQQTSSAGQDVKKNPHALLIGMQIGVAIMQNNMEDPQKKKKLGCHMTQ